MWEKIFTVGFLGFYVVGGLLAVRAEDSRPLSRNFGKGQEIYQKYCTECHGPEGRGDGPRAPFLAPKPGNLVSAATSTKSDQELLQAISEGVPRTAMRAWKDRLSEDEQHQVLAFLRSLVQFREPPLTPPPPE